MKQVIHIYGASGSGTTTLGRMISRKLGYRFLDTDDYYWMPTDPKYTTIREKGERLRLMREAIETADQVVISGSLCGWGDDLMKYFTLAVRLDTDTDVRIGRIRKREYENFGSRITIGGDMYENHQAFIEWAREYDTGGIEMRSRARHIAWQQSLQCHQICLNGAKDLDANFQAVQKEAQFLECIDQIQQAIQALFEGDASGHDYWHSIRVYRNVCEISLTEKCEWRVVALAALLHDADDAKLFQTKDYANAKDIMTACNVSEKLQKQVISAISAVSFKRSGTKAPDTIEGKIVQDADRLDAIGAVGIARAFAFGGSRGRKMYEPKEEPGKDWRTKKRHEGTTADHFYEKLFLLKECMNTEAARQIAKKRDSVMREFMDEFFCEWNGVR